MHHQRLVRFTVLGDVFQPETARQREIELDGGELPQASDGVHQLHIDFRAVERGFIRHLHERNFGLNQNLADQVFGFFPKLRFINELGVVAGQSRRIVGAEAHDIFLDAEDLEIL